MDLQELFDKVANHLLKQKARATDSSDVCVLRDNEGRACAWGCLIPESEYKPEMNSNFDSFAKIVSEYVDLNEGHIRLMCSLMRVHDCTAPSIWREELTNVANEFNLSTENLINE